MICAARQRDAYDIAVDYLAEHPEEIMPAWSNPRGHGRGCFLFRMAANDDFIAPDGSRSGCLTMIRHSSMPIGTGNTQWVAQTPELTAAIAGDERLPCDGGSIIPDHLPAFAEWNRELDRVLGRTPPAMEGA